jgi:hypothetical protein
LFFFNIGTLLPIWNYIGDICQFIFTIFN